jgi:uncharacterized protein (TIGR03663 family)
LRSRGLFLVPILLAAALRFPDLASRPIHADEAVHADKLGTLLEGGGYAYDPSEYHGPTLYYLTLPMAWLHGAGRYVEVDEVVLRSLPAALGVALVAAHLGARGLLGAAGALVAALLAAISPALVFYSRYFIHETPLVLFTFGALLGAHSYLRKPGPGAALLTGASLGLMHATKETAPLALGAMLLALASTVLFERWRGLSLPGPRSVVRMRDLLLALAVAALVSSLLFTSFLAHPRGLVDSVRAYGIYLERAGGASWHFHPWDYYLRLLIHFPSQGTPVWTEALVVVLSVAGAAAGFTARGVPGADARGLRFLGFYTLFMLVIYSAIPYKTPWCLLGFLHGMVLLAGAGAVFLVRAFRGVAVRAFVGLLMAAAAAHLGFQAWSQSFRFASDPRNPYVYAHTGTDVFEIVRRLEDLARAHPDGFAVPVQVISRTNLWPLPYYLRGFSRVAYWTGVSEESPRAPVILATPDMEGDLVRKLYDLPPPGERELYVSIFDRAVELRPQVELRGYAQSGLWEAFRQRQADRSPARSAGP